MERKELNMKTPVPNIVYK